MTNERDQEIHNILFEELNYAERQKYRYQLNREHFDGLCQRYLDDDNYEDYTEEQLESICQYVYVQVEKSWDDFIIDAIQRYL